MSDPRLPTTLDAIAALAGVHRSTASRVLAGNHAGNVSAATVSRILTAAHRLRQDNCSTGFRLIGLISGLGHHWSGAPLAEGEDEDGSHAFALRWKGTPYANLIANLAGVLAEDGWSLSLLDSNNLASNQGSTALANVAGAIIHDFAASSWDHLRSRLRGPSVLLNWPEEVCGVDVVDPDDRMGIAAVAGYLLQLGHRRVAWLQPEFPRHSRSHTVRRDGLATAIRAAGGHFSIAIDSPPMPWWRATGTDDGPTAIVCYHGLQVPAALAAIAAAGRRVPQDVSLVCGDDPAECRRLGVTAVHVPVDESATAAGRLLMDRLAGRRPAEPVHLLLPEHLNIRSTSGPVDASMP